MVSLSRAINLKTGKPAILHDISPRFLYGQAVNAEATLKGHFSHAGQNLDVGTQGDPWTVAVPSTKFATWLHGFEWLNDLAVSKDRNAAIRARGLVDKWVVIYGSWNPFSWAPDVLGHISRAPGQALEALEVLLTLDSLLQARGVEGSRAMSRAIDRLAPVVSFFTAADGKLSNFNGSGEGDKAYLKALRKAAPDITAKSFGYCPHTGYQRIEADGTVLIVDTGKTAPRPHDTQAHLAPLAFELSTELGRLVVNCGWNAAQPQSFRRAVRATAAHSTLILNDQSAGRLLKGGWASKCLGEAVAVEAGPVSVTRKEQVTGTWLESSHDSYRDETGEQCGDTFSN